MLTPAQQAIIKSHIIASSDLNSEPNTSDGAFAIAALLWLPVVPDYWIWSPESTSITTIMSNGFDWVRVDNMLPGKARIWEWMQLTGSINGSQPNVRAGVLAAFSSGADSGMRSAIFGHLQRPAKRLEKLFATGPGTTTNDQGVGPATTTWITGQLSYQDVYDARNS